MSKSNNAQVDKQPVPPKPVQGTPVASTSIDDLMALMARLRADCPWDAKQSNHSLIPYAIEEAYELAEAIQEGDSEDIKGELGDVLLQVIFHCQLYAEQGQFDFADVVEYLQAKLIRRHPHVFAADDLSDDKAVTKRWQQIKLQEQAERERQGKAKRCLDTIKPGSALMQAQNLQKAASKMGFDWDSVDGVIAKLEEEIAELKQALPKSGERLDQAQKMALEKELGDCMFALVNVARKLDLDAEMATLTCNHKFRSRFGFIETKLAEQGLTPATSSLPIMNELWELAKQYE